MRNISFFAVLLMLTGITLTGCKEDTQPRIEKPTEFILNRPAMADNSFILTPENSIELTVVPANYGQVLNVQYSVQMALENKWESKPELDDKNKPVLDKDGKPVVNYTYEVLPGKYTTSKFTIPAEDIAVAMCRLLGFKEEGQFVAGAHAVYVRVISIIPNWEEGTIQSNVIKLNSISPYFKLREPGVIYMIGQPQGWNIESDAISLRESEEGIGSKIYSGLYEISAGDAGSGFRFYTALGAWGENGQLPSIGSNPNDGDNKTVEVDEEGRYEGDCKEGKGNWSISNWPGGMMKITVDLDKMKVYFEKSQE